MLPLKADLGTERHHTDESLRIERAKADKPRGEGVAAVDALADAVIDLARARADELLEAARAKTDRRSAMRAGERGEEDTALREERVRADELVREERARADEMVREERAEKANLLEIERADTDKDLRTERIQSDVAVGTRDEFLALVSHDLRNMLATVVSFAELIEMSPTPDDRMVEVHHHARRIHRAGVRMDRLIGDLVDLASIEAGRLTVTLELGDPRQVVTEAVDVFQLQATAANITLVAELVEPIQRVGFDATRVLQVLSNLLSNAMKFTPAGGRITVQVACVRRELRFVVSDTGVGIPEDKLAVVFERFLQLPDRQHKGHGLGLYISKCIVEGHDGHIWAESRPGQGSRFCFVLPLLESLAA